MGIFDKAKSTINSLFEKRTDSWINSSTGLGLHRGRVGATRVKMPAVLGFDDLSNLYTSNGLARRIVNSLVDDSMRGNFIDVSDDEVKEEFKRLNLIKYIKETCYFSRLFGGAILVAFVDDGQDMDKPLNKKNLYKIVHFKVFDKQWITWYENDIIRPYLSERFGLPEFYYLNSPWHTQELMLKVHHSRCFLLDGVCTTEMRRRQRQNFGDSVLQSCFDNLRQYGLVSEASAEIVNDFIQVIVKLNGLASNMSRQGGREDLAMRAESLDLTRSTANLIFLDADKEDYEKKASSVAGLSDLWGKFAESMCAATGYPMTRLFGRSPGGLNSTGENDMRNYYDLVSAYRNDELAPLIDWLMNLITLQKTWEGEKEIEWNFCNLVEQTPLENAELKKKYAEIDAMYIDRGAIDAGEAWQERFGGEEFKEDIQLKKQEPQEDPLLDKETEAMMNSILSKEQNANQEKAKQDRRDIAEQEAIKNLQKLVDKL